MGIDNIPQEAFDISNDFEKKVIARIREQEERRYKKEERSCTDRNCNQTFTCTKRSRKQFCEDCSERRQRESWKKYREKQQTSGNLNAGGIKTLHLLCGHTLLFRMLPMPHEELFCERCDAWVLQRDGAKKARKMEMCKRGHIRTKFNTYINAKGHRDCKDCRLVREGES